MHSGRILDPRAAGGRRFEGKIAVVAGSGQGIGSATARRLAQEGATLVLGDWVQASAEKVCAELREFGAEAIIHVGDYSRWEDAQGLIDRAKQEFGRIDVLVNIVGGTIWWQTYEYYTPEQIIAEVNKSFWPTMWLCRAALPHMIEQKSGSIVNIATHAVVGRYRVPYAASKAGLIGLTSALSKEMGQYGIRINCVAPNSAIAKDRVTPRNYNVPIPATDIPPEQKEAQKRYMEQERPLEIPLGGRSGLAEEQAAAIAFLASDDASYITGEVIAVGGGMTYPF